MPRAIMCASVGVITTQYFFVRYNDILQKLYMYIDCIYLSIFHSVLSLGRHDVLPEGL